MRELASTPSAQPFALTGLFWNGNAEQVDSIDDVSGASAVLGTLGDFQYWSLECLESSERTHVFSVGHGADDGIELYDFELANAGLRTLALAEEYALAGTLADGRLLAVYTNGNVRQVDALDPQTGQAQKLGDFGDLMVGNFFGWLAFDAKRGLLYALGTDAIDSNQNKLYAFDLAKGVTRSVPVDELPWAVGGVRRDGTLLAIRWTGDAEIAAAIDPDSGAVHELGQLGDLQLWMGRPLYVEANDSLYTPGFDANNTRFLYRLDLATGTSSQVPLGANYTLVKR